MGSDVWIGLDVNIIGGIEISDGAVVLSRAVVTKDVPPYAIVGGVPARIIGYRYDAETIDFLLRVKWWNNDEQWFRENWMLLNDIEKFKRYFKSKI
ncbi:MAG: antibiotic acetyltransferase [Paraprevotella sp.]|nr:antibiotic acetyltransferase [Paraprevotella sp.]